MTPDGLRARADALRAARSFFAQRGYLEVPTPVLVSSAAMEEHLYPLRADSGLLRTSPEFALKRVLSLGLGRIYEIGPCFRGRESGPWHGTEFTMLEWYRVGADLEGLAREAVALVECVQRALNAPTVPWRFVTVRELFLEICDLDLATASATDIHPREPTWDDAFFRRWVEDIEPALRGGMVIRDWPASQAALAQIRNRPDWPTAQRFEIYYEGVELGNAFLELLDPQEQRARFHQANAARLQAGEPPHPIDEAFIEAVGRMPTCAGIAVGFDRLVAAISRWPGLSPGRVPN